MTSGWKAGPDHTPAHLADGRKAQGPAGRCGTSSVCERRALSAASRACNRNRIPVGDCHDRRPWGLGRLATQPCPAWPRSRSPAHSPSGWPRAPTLCYGIRGGLGRFTSGPAVSPGRGWRRCPQPSRRGSEDEGRQVVHAGIRRVVRSLAVPVGGGGAARTTFVRSGAWCGPGLPSICATATQAGPPRQRLYRR